MNEIFLEAKVLWAQIDANMHLRHSAYADFAAQARVEMLATLGLTASVMQAEKLGPILFKEETIYLKEVKPNDTIKVSCKLSKCRKDGSRWSFSQEIYRGDSVVAARINVEGAWINMETRKLTAPPQVFVEKLLALLPRTEDFILEVLPKKTS